MQIAAPQGVYPAGSRCLRQKLEGIIRTAPALTLSSGRAGVPSRSSRGAVIARVREANNINKRI